MFGAPCGWFLRRERAPVRFGIPDVKLDGAFEVLVRPDKHTLGMEFTRTGVGPHKESLGTMKLYVDDKVAAEVPMNTQPGKFTLSGDGLCIGYDSGDAVSRRHDARQIPWRNDPGRRGHGRKSVV